MGDGRLAWNSRSSEGRFFDSICVEDSLPGSPASRWLAPAPAGKREARQLATLKPRARASRSRLGGRARLLDRLRLRAHGSNDSEPRTQL